MDKFLIAPINSGLQTDLVPFMLMDDAFSFLQSMFIYNGKIRRCAASTTLLLDGTTDFMGSRLKIRIGVTNAITGDLPATVIPGIGEIGQQFSVDYAQKFTVYQANGAMYVSPAGATGTFNIGTNTVTITGATPNTIVYWYPCTQVVGFANYFTTQTILFAFDLEFAYRFDATGFERVVGGAGLFTGTGNYKIQYENFQGAVSGEPALFITNNVDNIRYYTNTIPTFTNFIPATSAVANYNIRRCIDIIVFEERLLLLNTVEYEGAIAEVSHHNRIRYSESGNVFAVDSWYQAPAINNKGGFVDLPIDEVIITAEILGGRLIIFTEKSLYELVSTGNYREPFQVSRIDSTLGTSSQNVVEVNNELLFVNNFGIYTTDGNNTNKISIPLNDTFDDYEYRYGTIYKDDDYGLIYILASTEVNNEYPNIMIIYNYINKTFSIIFSLQTAIDKIYYGSAGDRFIRPLTIVGNHRGHCGRLDYNCYKNATRNNITSITYFDANHIDLKIYNHQLFDILSIRIEGSLLPDLNGSYNIVIIDADTIRIENDTSVVGNYLGDGSIAVIDKISIRTKQFNPYMKKGFGTLITKINVNLNRTDNIGVISVYGLPNNSITEIIPINFYLGSRKLLSTGQIPIEFSQDRVWHHVYTQTQGESVALLFTFSNDELLDDISPYQQFTINAIMLYTEPVKYI